MYPQFSYGNYYQQPQQNLRQPVQVQGLKGRPVSSLDEVRATAVDFDGSISYFPNLANDTIYTKQINLDGTSSVRVYELKETAAAGSPVDDLVTKDEFTKTINGLLEQIQALQNSQPVQPVTQPSPPQEYKF